MSTLSLPTPSTVSDAIEQTLEWLDHQSGASGEDTGNRRNTQRGRYRVNARITYHPPGQPQTNSFDVHTRNLSRTGLSFLHRTLIYPRQPVEIQLPLPDRSVRHLRGKVTRVRPAGAGLYEIGIEFTEMEVALAE